jgi:N-ethylmaleimide reductase
MSLQSLASQQPLLCRYDLGSLQLRNRVIMAPMTRARADNRALAPTELHREYYRQRAGAGLIVSEGTWVSEGAIGSINVPGMYSEEQVQGWTGVTEAVHSAGGVIFAQLAHTGAASHPYFQQGRLPGAPSAVNPVASVMTPHGPEETVTPRALTTTEIAGIVEEYRLAAENARRAGFDGIEIHAQRGYLIAQFLNPALNLRTDAYGGSPENNARFLFEVLDAVTGAWGPRQVGIKLAPHQAASPSIPVTSESLAIHDHIVRRLNDYPLAYLHLMMTRLPNVTVTGAEHRESLIRFRPLFNGTLIANASFDQDTGNEVISAGLADLVSFAAPFIANPDLPARFEQHYPIALGGRDTFYQGGARGYIDYPPLSTLAEATS